MTPADIAERGTTGADATPAGDGTRPSGRRETTRLGIVAVACSAAGTALGFIPLTGLVFLCLNAAGVVLGGVCLVVSSHRRRWLSLSLAAIALGAVGGLVVWTFQSLVLHGRMH